MELPRWIDRLDDRFGAWAVPGVTRVLVGGNSLAYFLLASTPEFRDMLILSGRALEQGQVWRILTFMCVPEVRFPLFFFLFMWFTWFVGDALEEALGPFRLNLFLLVAMLSVAGVSLFLAGPVTNFFIFGSLLLAFGTLFPDYPLMIFPLPFTIQAKYLALFKGFFMLYYFAVGTMGDRLLILASLAGYVVFFLSGVFRVAWSRLENRKRMRRFRGED